jgi:hypothetical protein
MASCSERACVGGRGEDGTIRERHDQSSGHDNAQSRLRYDCRKSEPGYASPFPSGSSGTWHPFRSPVLTILPRFPPFRLLVSSATSCSRYSLLSKERGAQPEFRSYWGGSRGPCRCWWKGRAPRGPLDRSSSSRSVIQAAAVRRGSVYESEGDGVCFRSESWRYSRRLNSWKGGPAWCTRVAGMGASSRIGCHSRRIVKYARGFGQVEYETGP